MKTQIATGKRPGRHFLVIALCLLILAPLCLGACATPRAMNYAKSKASPSNVVEFSIGKVHSAQIYENSDISVLVQLDNLNHPKSGLYRMTVPFPCLAGKTDAIGSFGFREKYTPYVSGLPSYLYPMVKANKVNEEVVTMKDSPASPVPIEELDVHRDQTERVLELLGDLSRDPSGAQKVYVVNLLSDDAGKQYEKELGNTVDKDILLVCLPPLSSGSPLQPIAIAGAYEDESTNLYYLLVPPAIAVDAFLTALAVAVYAAGGVLVGPQ